MKTIITSYRCGGPAALRIAIGEKMLPVQQKKEQPGLKCFGIRISLKAKSPMSLKAID
jgi:hypothetical protein